MRQLIIVVILSVLICFLFIGGMTLGSAAIGLSDVWSGIVGNSSDSTNYIITEVRLPRTITALIAGMA